jgi:hypothetical protein
LAETRDSPEKRCVDKIWINLQPHHWIAQEENTMRRVKLRVTEEERYIGIVITKNLKSYEQCSKAAGRATALLNQLKRNFHYRLNSISITSNHT